MESHESISHMDILVHEQPTYQIYFDHIDDENTYINAYIIKCIKSQKKILEVTDIYGNNIDINQDMNAEIIKRYQNYYFYDFYKEYEHAYNNMIYMVYFGTPNIDVNTYNYRTTEDFIANSCKYKLIRDKLSFTGMNYYYHRDGTILRKCFHTNGIIEGKFYGFWYIDRENYHVCAADIDYVNGNIHGNYIRYHTNGEIYIQCKFENNKIIEDFSVYDSHGNPNMNCNYDDGKINGKFTYMEHSNKYPYVQLIVTSYINSIEHGIRAVYHFDENVYKYKLVSTCEYENGEKNGIKMKYDIETNTATLFNRILSHFYYSYYFLKKLNFNISKKYT